MMALKLASLGRGASGVRPADARACWRPCWNAASCPVVPSQGSVGASGDLAPLAHLAGGDARRRRGAFDGEAMPAACALGARRARSRSCSAPRKGSRCSTARSSRPRTRWPACSTHRAGVPGGARHRRARRPMRRRAPTRRSTPRIHALRGHRGQIEVAAALRALMAGSAIRASHLADDDRVQDPYCLRCQPQVMGAVLDLLRQAAATLATEANGVSDNPLVFAGSGEALSGGNFHAEPVAFAADMLAIAICEIGSLAERRIAMLVDPALSGLPAFLTPQPGLNSGFMIAAGDGGGAGVREQAARLSGQRRFDPDLGEPGGPRLDGGAWRAPARRHGGERRQRRRASSCSPRRRAATSTRRSLEPAARAGARAAARTRAARSRTTATSRPTSRRRPSSCAPARWSPQPDVDLPGIEGRECMTEPWLDREARRCAAAGVSFPHTGTEHARGDARPRSCRSRLARHDADWHIDKLYAFAAELGATTVHTALSRTVIDVNRDPSGASLYPGQTTTGLVPTETFDGRAALPRRRRRPRRTRSSGARRSISRPIIARSPRSSSGCAPCIRAWCSTIATPSARSSRGCLPANCRCSTSAPIHGKSCDSALEAAVAHRLRREPVVACGQRAVHGRLDHPHLRPPCRRRPCRADGACDARLPSQRERPAAMGPRFRQADPADTARRARRLPRLCTRVMPWRVQPWAQ